MKSLLILAVLGALGAGILGCEASAKVGDDHGGTAYKKETTTVREPDGDVRTTTEVKKY